MAGKVRHLLHVNGRYSARVVVPEALRSIVGKRELLQPLGADRVVALRKLPGAVAEMQAVLDAARARAKEGEAPRAPARRGRPLTAEQMAREHYCAQIGFDQEVRESDESAGLGFNDDIRVADLGRAMAGAANNAELEALVGHIVASFRLRGHTEITPASPDFRRTAMALAVAEREALAVSAARDEGDTTAATSHPLLAAEKPLEPMPVSPRILGPLSAKTLSEIVPLMMTEKRARPATAYEYGVAVRMFEEHLGEARPVHTITRRDVLSYKTALMETPASYSLRFPNMPLPEAIKRNKARATPFPVLNVTTVNDKWLARLQSIFKWCVLNDVLPDNPASGIKVDQIAETSAPRVPFTPGDLAKIFAPPLFQKGAAFEEQQWALLIALHTGFRASEIAQLKLDSVRHERGVLAFAVEEQVKTRGSTRLLPVHSALTRLGIESRVTALRTAGETHLFPDWYRKATAVSKSNAHRARTIQFSQMIPRWFNRTYLPSIGIIDDRKVFHSFRHGMKTALARAGVPRSISDDITGHDDQTAGGRYVHETSIEAMKDALEKIHFDGFTL
ncbi:Tyrosine recombinase XerC [Methylobacterium adhaesivum]|uniref:Site-specific integrase n=1 Tax=Methylobacterium adhaesivum TaxID=333297 RepID=A0ABT8BJV3_9HYPH|nr:site-specific integrase [Methylobacterium adhaesivum]MDN3592381.1 site-specific integrase [Methylobacterium adhaesivum]GJD31897.1 Tyrosine recombinase XerC [Methylobacterium adhaesivum]